MPTVINHSSQKVFFRLDDRRVIIVPPRGSRDLDPWDLGSLSIAAEDERCPIDVVIVGEDDGRPFSVRQVQSFVIRDADKLVTSPPNEDPPEEDPLNPWRPDE